MIHELKTWPEYFADIASEVKTFEIRRNDRNFQVGDELLLCEWCPKAKEYSGRICLVKVTYMTDYGQPDGQVVMGIERIDVHAKGRRK